MLTTIPEGCTVRWIGDDRFAPDLCAGDCVVVDRHRREPQHGALALLQSSGPDGWIALIELPDQVQFAGAPDLDRFPLPRWAIICGRQRVHYLSATSKSKALGKFVTMLDGHLSEGALRERMLGIVVAILRPAEDT